MKENHQLAFCNLFKWLVLVVFIFVLKEVNATIGEVEDVLGVGIVLLKIKIEPFQMKRKITQDINCL